MRTVKKLLREFFVGLMVFALLIQSVGCSYTYVSKYSAEDNGPRMEKLVEKDRRFFVHARSDTFELVNCEIVGDGIMGEKSELEAKFYYFPGKKNRYKPKEEPTLTKEVHIYLPSQYVYSETDSGTITIPFQDADRILVVKKNKSARTIIIAGILVGGFVIFGVIYAFATADSWY